MTKRPEHSPAHLLPDSEDIYSHNIQRFLSRSDAQEFVSVMHAGMWDKHTEADYERGRRLVRSISQNGAAFIALVIRDLPNTGRLLLNPSFRQKVADVQAADAVLYPQADFPRIAAPEIRLGREETIQFFNYHADCVERFREAAPGHDEVEATVALDVLGALELVLQDDPVGTSISHDANAKLARMAADFDATFPDGLSAR